MASRLLTLFFYHAVIEVGAWFAANQIRKTYLARVQGRFEQLLKGGAPTPRAQITEHQAPELATLTFEQATCRLEPLARMAAST